MARPRAFDERAVLDAATDVFWAKGFEAASTRELSASTGLTPSSMYAAFGDKEGLFRCALDHYLGRLHDRIASLESAGSPAHAISGFLADIIERSLADPLQRGCMLVNSALEATPTRPELREAVAHELNTIERFFHRSFAAAQQCGATPSTYSADDAARQLLAVLLGIRVLARAKPERELLTGAARQTLEGLGLPPLPDTSGRSARSKRDAS
jgi:TetR/AcrR family transcriptional repressor of nem operon